MALAFCIGGARKNISARRSGASFGSAGLALREVSIFRMIIENAPLGVFVVGDSGTVEFCNKSAEAIFSSSGRKLAGAKIYAMLPGAFVIDGELSLSGFHPELGRNRIALPSARGGVNKYEIRQSHFVDDGGRRLNVVMLNDVTNFVDAEKALKSQEERWNLALQGSQIGVFESDLLTGTGSASDTWYQMVGISNSKGLNSDEEWRKRVHPDDLDRVVATDAECIDGKTEKAEAKYRIRVRDGNWHWMHSILRATERDRAGKAVRLLGTMTDITLLENAVELAQAKEAEVEAFIANAPVAMAVLALTGKFLILNAACYRLLGYPEGTLAGRSLWRLSNTKMLSELRAEIEGLIQGEVSTFKAEKCYERPDGTKVDFVIRMSMISGNTSEQTRIVAQMVDITEKNRLAKLKDDFLATVSHELRTPLTVVHGALGLLQGMGGLSGQSEKLLGLASRNSDRLLQLVDDLLDFQKLNTGQVSLEMAVVNIVELVEQAVEEIEPVATKFGISLVVDAAQKGLWVRADPLRVKQVIANLLSNAAKFSPPGDSIEVRIDEFCTVSVSDHGRGISPEFRGRIFLPFSQQAEHSTRDREGSGLGLAISKGLVERMGGEIGYESVPNVRTTFWVRFPQAAETERNSSSKKLHLVR